MITNAIGILFSPQGTWQRLATVADRASNLVPAGTPIAPVAESEVVVA